MSEPVNERNIVVSTKRQLTIMQGKMHGKRFHASKSVIREK